MSKVSLLSEISDNLRYEMALGTHTRAACANSKSVRPCTYTARGGGFCVSCLTEKLADLIKDGDLAGLYVSIQGNIQGALSMKVNLYDVLESKLEREDSA